MLATSYLRDKRQKLTDFTWGLGHGANPLLCDTILKDINRAIIDQHGNGEPRPAWEQEASIR